MGLIGILVAVILLVLFLVFSNSPFSPFTKSPVNTKNVEQNAAEAVGKTLQNSKLENSQIKNIDE